MYSIPNKKIPLLISIKIPITKKTKNHGNSENTIPSTWSIVAY